MNADQHPALITGHTVLPTLTLILPTGLDGDQILQGLVQAIEQARTDLAARVDLFQHRVQECAASGDKLSQALCRGQVIGGEHAAMALDEEIIGQFDLWDQYDTTPQTRQHPSARQAPQAASPPAGDAGLSSAPGRRSLGLGRLEAAVMAVAWQAAGGWLPGRTVHDRLHYPRPVTYPTTASAITTLHRKGLLARRRGPAGRWEYQAARSADEHLGELIGELIDACPSPADALSHALRRPVRLASATNQ